MTLKIELHPEVVKFLRETDTVWPCEDFGETFVVNHSWYKPTDIPNVYIVELLKVKTAPR